MSPVVGSAIRSVQFYLTTRDNSKDLNTTDRIVAP
jgi:hypothetical protein